MVELQRLRVGYHGKEVLHDISLSLMPGKVTVLLGPNGCGKSTLLRAVSGLQPRSAGQILVDGLPSEQFSSKQLAQKIAYLPQARTIPNISAYRLVLHGRFPYLSYPRRYRQEDHEAALDALRWTDATDLADCLLPELSGGQRQKAYLAMALAQGTDTILMDEPTTYLDVQHQLEVMRISRRLAEQRKTVVLVLHDLCLAMRYADEVVTMDAGQICHCGTPEEIYNSGTLDRVFEITMRRSWTETGWQYYYG